MILNFYSILTIFTVIVNLLFFRFIIFRVKKNKALRYYSVAIIFTIIWQITKFINTVFSFSDELIIIFWKIGDITAIYVVLFLFYFIATYTEKYIRSFYNQLLFVATSMIGLFIVFSDNYILGIAPHKFLKVVAVGDTGRAIQNLTVFLLFILTLVVLLKVVKEKKGKENINLEKHMLVGAVIAITMALITDIIFPWFKIEFLQLGGLATTIFIGTVIVAMYKFQFLDIRPEKFSIGQKLTLSIFFIVILLVVLINFITLSKIKSAENANIKIHVADKVFLKEHELIDFIEKRKEDVKNLAEKKNFVDNVIFMTEDHSSSSLDVAKHHANVVNLLQEKLDSSKQDFIELFILSMNGEVHLSTDNKQVGKNNYDKNYFLIGKQETYIENFYFNDEIGEYSLIISTPIKDGDKIIGVLGGKINTKNIITLLEEKSGLFQSEKIYLVNRNNNFINEAGESIKDKNKFYSEGIESCFRRIKNEISYINHKNIPVVGASRSVMEREVCLLYEISQQDAFSSLNKLQNTIIIVSILIIILVFLLNFLFINQITSSIGQLVRGNKEFAKGNFKYKVNIKSSDELGILGDAFNKTGKELTRAREAEKRISMNLEQEVAIKTEKLSKALKDVQEDKKDLENQRLATLNILEDISESKQELEELNDTLEKKGDELGALKALSDELASVFDIEEAIIVTNKYLSEFFEYDVANYLVINNIDEGGVVYMSFVKNEVGEKYIDDTELELLRHIKNKKEIKQDSVFKIVKNVRPKLFGKKLNNKTDKKPRTYQYFSLSIGEKKLGIIQLISDKKEIVSKKNRNFIDAIIITATLSVDRLQTLILAQHSKTVSLVESLKDGVIMFNTNEEIVLMNPSFVKYTGFSQEHFALSDLYRLITDFKLNDMVMKVLNFGKMSHINEVILINRNYEILITPVRDNQGQIVGGAIIFHDITYLKEIDKMKVEFVSVASHQLRTPLTAIKLFTEMIIRGDVGKINKEQNEYLDNIHQSTERMVQLVNDLLSLSRLESGRLRVEPIPTQIEKLIQGNIDEIKPLADAKKCKIIFNKPDKKLPKISIDETLMRQVIHNLLTNSIRYSKENNGKTTINIELKGENYLLSFKDNGIGITLKDQKKIFQKFYRADNAVKKDTEGTGLGLYVCKLIVESSGGKIWFKSKEEEGTEFFISIPVKGMQAKQGDKKLAGRNEISYS